MTSPAWVSLTHPVINGEDVNSTVTNRFPDELGQRTDYLKAVLDSIGAGEAIYARNVAVNSTVKVGHAVYWDAATQQYDLGLAKVEFNNTIGGYSISKSSYIVGICVYKYTSTRADIIQIGLAKDINFTEATGATGNTIPTSGPYYLSANTPGHYTQIKPPVSVFVGFLRGDGSMHVNPTPRDMLESHIHYVIDLFAQPAGITECIGTGREYTFSSTDVTKPGWLPADHTSFNGLAPAGAKFGYNLAAHPELERLWPPLPAANAYMEEDGLGVSLNRFQVDINGLWWFEDCYSRAPWPTNLCECTYSSGSSSSSCIEESSSFASGTCASESTLEQMGFLKTEPDHKSLRLYFTKMVFKTNNTLVTSLAPATGSPIEVLDCGGQPATTGDLKLALNLALAITENQLGYKVFKDVTGTTFKRGKIVEGIKAGSFCTLTPVTDEGETDEDGFNYGKMTLNVTTPNSNQEGQIILTELFGVNEQTVDNTFYLEFPKERATSLIARLNLPSSNLPTNPKLRLVFWLFGKIAGTLPALEVSVRNLGEPALSGLVNLSASSFTAISNLAQPVLSGTNQYTKVQSDLITVVAGQQLNFKITRTGFGNSGDSYNGSMGILRYTYVVTAS